MKPLIIGLGGIGVKVMEIIRSKVGDTRAKYLGIDLFNETKSQIPFIELGQNFNLEKSLNKVKNWQEWFPNDPLLLAKKIPEWYSVRAITRLCWDKRDDLEVVLSEALGISDESDKSLEVNQIIITSLAGSTGSVLAVEVPLKIRKILNQVNLTKKIRGYFIAPELVVSAITDPVERENTFVRAYATLKEIEAINSIVHLPENTELNFRMELPDFNSDKETGNFQLNLYDLIFLIGENPYLENYIELEGTLEELEQNSTEQKKKE